LDSTFNIFAVCPSDFRSLTSLPPQTNAGVYIFCAPNGDVLYVGQSGDLRTRINTHKRTRPWAKSDGIIVTVYPLRDAETRLILEAVTILRLRPRHNKVIQLVMTRDRKFREVRIGRT